MKRFPSLARLPWPAGAAVWTTVGGHSGWGRKYHLFEDCANARHNRGGKRLLITTEQSAVAAGLTLCSFCERRHDVELGLIRRRKRRKSWAASQ